MKKIKKIKIKLNGKIKKVNESTIASNLIKSFKIPSRAFFCSPEGISSLNISKKSSDINYVCVSSQTDPAPLAKSLILEI